MRYCSRLSPFSGTGHMLYFTRWRICGDPSLFRYCSGDSLMIYPQSMKPRSEYPSCRFTLVTLYGSADIMQFLA
jgi:hypothetical protein